MEREYHEGDMLLPTEWVRDGWVWDTRRLTQEAHWFLTRKSGKTELGGAVDFTEVGFLGDVNGQALICTNSSEQSQIAYKAIREFAMQVDPTCSNRMGGKYFRMTRNGLNWQPGHPMKGEIKCRQDLEGRTLRLGRSCRRARTGGLRERPLRHASGSRYVLGLNGSAT